MNKTNAEMVKEFMNVFGHHVAKVPTLVNKSTFDFRLLLIEEELQELKTAFNNHNLIEVADSLGDLLYVVYGAAHTMGIPIDEVFSEIQRSNMTKLGKDGKPIYRADGKIMKGPHWEKPKINAILNKYVNE